MREGEKYIGRRWWWGQRTPRGRNRGRARAPPRTAISLTGNRIIAIYLVLAQWEERDITARSSVLREGVCVCMCFYIVSFFFYSPGSAN